jgi:hypothetical protein
MQSKKRKNFIKALVCGLQMLDDFSVEAADGGVKPF